MLSQWMPVGQTDSVSGEGEGERKNDGEGALRKGCGVGWRGEHIWKCGGTNRGLDGQGGLLGRGE